MRTPLFTSHESKDITPQALWENERHLAAGATSIAGVDEAGRGCLAGPVFAAAVVLTSNAEEWTGVADSKLLPKKARDVMWERIRQRALAIGIGISSVAEIDSLNILRASMLAMSRAIQALHTAPDVFLIDGPYTPSLLVDAPMVAVIDGDAKCLSIAAASIVAKVERDRYMTQLALEYRGYGFERNMGYGTKEHLLALDTLGPTPCHRHSFAPVRSRLQSELRLDF